MRGLTKSFYSFTDAYAKTTTIEQSSPLHFFPALLRVIQRMEIYTLVAAIFWKD